MDRYVTRSGAPKHRHHNCCQPSAPGSSASSSASLIPSSNPPSTPSRHVAGIQLATSSPLSSPLPIRTIQSSPPVGTAPEPDPMEIDAEDEGAKSDEDGEVGENDILAEHGGFRLNRKDLPRGWKASYLRRKRAKKSFVWQHGFIVKNKENKDYFLCKRCHQSKSRLNHIFSVKGTGHIIEHLRRFHQLGRHGHIFVPTPPPPATMAHEEAMYHQVINPQNLEDLQKAYIKYIVVENMTYRKGVSPYLKDIFSRLNPTADGLVPAAHKSIGAWIEKHFKLAKAEVKRLLSRSIGRINISFDGWTNDTSARHQKLYAVVAHFMDIDGRAWTLPIGLPEQPAEDNGINLAEIIHDVLDDMGIAGNVNFFMSDNSTVNDNAIDALVDALGLDKADNTRLRCAGHILDLVVEAMLRARDCKGIEREPDLDLGPAEKAVAVMKALRAKGPLGKLDNIIKHIRRSKGSIDAFIEIQQTHAPAATRANVNGFVRAYVPKGISGVKWGSDFMQIESGVQLRMAIDITSLNDDALSEDRLSRRDWKMIEKYYELLKPLFMMTRRLEGNPTKDNRGSHGALWEVLPMMDFILDHLETWKQLEVTRGDDDYAEKAVKLGHTKLDKYYLLTDKSYAYRAAVVLHPSRKFDYFDAHWYHRREWIKTAKEVVKAAWLAFKERHEQQGQQDGPECLGSSEVTVEAAEQDERENFKEMSEFERFLRKPKAGKQRKVLDEFERYCAIAPEPEVTCPLQWWFDRRADYPVLSIMAIELFTCPGESTECERIFSDTGRSVTDDRNLLAPESLEQEELLRKWIKAGILW